MTAHEFDHDRAATDPDESDPGTGIWRLLRRARTLLAVLVSLLTALELLGII